MPALDGLRGLAILLVIMTHVSGGWNVALSIVQTTDVFVDKATLPAWLVPIAASAANGVQLFFVVSAFTLTCRAGMDRGGLAGYAIRRITRIGPGYWLAALAYTAVAGMATVRVFAPDGISVTDLLIASVFGSAWTGGPAMAVVPGGWSVSCEASFYLALPLILLVIDGRIWRAAVLTGLVIVANQIWARHLLLGGMWTFFTYAHPFDQAPVFLLGVTAALVAMRVRLPAMPKLAILLLAFAVLVWPFSPINDSRLLRHVSFAVIVAMATALAAAAPPGLLANRFAGRLGEVSYSMYLIHFAVLAPSLWLAEWLVPAGDWRTFSLHYVFTVTVTFGAANLTYRLIERPPMLWASAIRSRSAEPLRT
jgi:peptidoglycan/LPS O-acetylase OafA/YrhL